MESAASAYDWFLFAALGSSFHFFFFFLQVEKKEEAMNILEQEINKSRINIYVPKGM